MAVAGEHRRRRVAVGPVPSGSLRTESRMQAAAYWATHPLSRTMLVLTLMTGLVVIPLASWTPGVFAAIAPAVLPLLGLGCVVLAVIAAGQDLNDAEEP